MFYKQSTTLKKILSRNGYYQPEIWVSFTLAKHGAMRLLWQIYFVKNFISKNLFQRKVQFGVLEELEKLYLLDDLSSTFF
jgi:hypothetical protein